MGWTSYHAPTIYDEKKKRYVVDRKAECDKLYNCNMVENRGKYEVLKSAVSGSTYYAAVRKTIYATEATPEKVEVFGTVVLTHTDTTSYYNFSYKDMDETMGPYSFDCPKGILDLLTPTNDEYANIWRQKCEEKREAKRNPDSLRKLPVGTEIEVILPFDTKYHSKGDKVRLVKARRYGRKRSAWWKGSMQFTAGLMRQLDGHYSVIRRGLNEID